MGTTYLHAVARWTATLPMSATTWGRSTTGISTATIPSSTKTTPMFTVRHSGSQRPRLTTCVACGRARRCWSSGGTNST